MSDISLACVSRCSIEGDSLIFKPLSYFVYLMHCIAILFRRGRHASKNIL